MRTEAAAKPLELQDRPEDTTDRLLQTTDRLLRPTDSKVFSSHPFAEPEC